ncbi:XdhC family protein [Burkholderia sp. JPY481]
MDAVDVAVILNAASWLEKGHRVSLVTVVSTWGSAPRPVGSMLAIREDGRLVGSVSGGCIEDDLLDRLRREGMHSTLPQVVTYGISADEAHRFGLPCGGTLRLIIEYLSENSRLREVLTAIRKGKVIVRALDVESGQVSISEILHLSECKFDGRRLYTVLGPQYRMLLIGAGDLSRYVAQISIGLGYNVTICDPREEYGVDWNEPNVRVVRTMPDDTVLDMRPDARTAVIALTHDPKLDDLALMEALKTPAFYVGVIGSRRNVAARRERLMMFDVTEDELGRLRGPVGLFIGSRTPAEIAISILAEVTACKNSVSVVRAIDVEAGKHSCERRANTDSGTSSLIQPPVEHEAMR